MGVFDELVPIGPGVSKRLGDCTGEDLEAAGRYMEVLAVRHQAAAVRLEAGGAPACDYQYREGRWCENDAEFIKMPSAGDEPDPLDPRSFCAEHKPDGEVPGNRQRD